MESVTDAEEVQPSAGERTFVVALALAKAGRLAEAEQISETLSRETAPLHS